MTFVNLQHAIEKNGTKCKKNPPSNVLINKFNVSPVEESNQRDRAASYTVKHFLLSVGTC